MLKMTIARALIAMVMILVISCAGKAPEISSEQKDELIRLRRELVQLDSLLKAEEAVSEALRTENKLLKSDINTERQRGDALKAELDRLRAKMDGNYIVDNRIILPNTILFPSGSATLSNPGKQFINEISEFLGKYPDRTIYIEGHTDNVPIASHSIRKYPSNWELASARAMAVLHFIESDQSINPKRFGVISFGEQRPQASNATPKGRAQNRRVEIVIGSSDN
ncbi:MAG: OmpA family protein [Candidatus Marinimicrobia bacterium]|nr:OmpA family protein [Candidatus Neomarinimicrobiota bacterium]MCF7904082.1 OmpA family protein [Candidatus Neomarinimicrobiota bacterium]